MHMWNTESELTAEWNYWNDLNCTAKTWETDIIGAWNPNETTKPRTAEIWEHELSAEWNPNEITKACTTEPWESELTVEWNHKNVHCWNTGKWIHCCKKT